MITSSSKQGQRDHQTNGIGSLDDAFLGDTFLSNRIPFKGYEDTKTSLLSTTEGSIRRTRGED